jgi:molybdopterin molybdotransferase
MSYPTGIAFAQALAITQRVGDSHRLAAERVTLRESRGRVLSETIEAPLSLPSFDNSAMDGFALRSADLESAKYEGLRLVGEQFAGRSIGFRLGPGECVRITTGAPVPEGADTIAMKENVRVEGERVVIQNEILAGANLRRAGEDVETGQRLFAPGLTLNSAQLGLLAALGLPEVGVSRRPSVAVFTTGDELKPAGTTLAPGEIFDSNRLLLQSLLAEEGIATLSWPALPDDEARIAAALDDAAQAYDLILTCGGVSAGEKDLLPGLLARHGEIHFWKVMMRPGMPVLLGRWGRALLLGLPGNPVSVLATFRRLALPLIDAMQGRHDRAPSLRARLSESVSKSHRRLEFRRAQVTCDANGQLWVAPHPAVGSHQQRGAAESNALMLLDETMHDFEAGTLVEVEVYGAILRA